MITKALQHSVEPVSRGEKMDSNSRAPVLFTKEEAVRKVELSPDIESLHMDMNILKTLCKKQEKGQEQHKKTIQSLIESM